MTLGQKIQEIRRARGYSQDAVAENIGISSTAYARIERNESDVSIKRLQSIAKTLEVDIWAFFLPQTSVMIVGDIGSDANGHNNGVQHFYPNDFKTEREAYQRHIQNLEKSFSMLEKQLNEKQKIIDSFLSMKK